MNSSRTRRERGAVYTPDILSRYLIETTVGPLCGSATSPVGKPPTVIDPACGDGQFLVEAARLLASRTPASAIEIAGALRGMDIDREAVEITRSRLAEVIVEPGRSLARTLQSAVTCGDALLTPPPTECWDAVVANPPFVNIRRITSTLGDDVKRQLRTAYQTARGNYDLYVLFVELACRLLRDGGRCGIIVPSKLATADYARACRHLLQQQSIEQVIDVSQASAFPRTGVYPYIIVWTKKLPSTHHVCRFVRVSKLDQLQTAKSSDVLQSKMAADRWRLDSSLAVESRVATVRLDSVAVLHSGTSGFRRGRLASQLRDVGDESGDDWGDCNQPLVAGDATSSCREESSDFIVSGNIDRYCIRLGNVQFMKRRYQRPRLRIDSPALSERKRQLFASRKIVVAGMTRRIEATWDNRGLALGVQVYAVVPRSDVCPFVLLAYLNSKLFSFLLRRRFQARQMAGGYLAINKGPLAELPVVQTPASESTRMRRLRECAQVLQGGGEANRDGPVEDDGLVSNDGPVEGSGPLEDGGRVAEAARGTSEVGAGAATGESMGRQWGQWNRDIDAIVYALYRLTDAEIDMVEREVATDAGPATGFVTADRGSS